MHTPRQRPRLIAVELSLAYLSCNHTHDPLLGVLVVAGGIRVWCVLDELRLLSRLVSDGAWRGRGNLRADELFIPGQAQKTHSSKGEGEEGTTIHSHSDMHKNHS